MIRSLSRGALKAFLLSASNAADICKLVTVPYGHVAWPVVRRLT